MTVLFADVVDSTELGERLDPEQFAEIMNGAFAFLNASVNKYGGTVAQAAWRRDPCFFRRAGRT